MPFSNKSRWLDNGTDDCTICRSEILRIGLAQAFGEIRLFLVITPRYDAIEAE